MKLISCRHRRSANVRRTKSRRRQLMVEMLEDRRLLWGADGTFGVGGLSEALAVPGEVNLRTPATATDSLGNILVASSSQYQSMSRGGGNPFIARFKSDGSVDRSFGINGVSKLPFTKMTINGLAVDSSNRILIAGSLVNSSNGDQIDSFIARVLQNGQLDTSFSNTGIAIHSFTSVLDGAEADNAEELQMLKISPAGKVVVAGYARTNSTYSMYVWTVARLNDDGTFDTSFSGDGRHTIQLGLSPWHMSQAFGVSVLPDESMIVTGHFDNYIGGGNGGLQLAAVKLASNGNLDQSFGQNGQALDTAPGWERWRGWSHSVDPQGRIYVGGFSGAAGGGFKRIVRFSANGQQDTSFGISGVVSNLGSAPAQDIAGGSKIVLHENDSISRVRVINSDGSLDTSFGTSGVLSLNELRNPVYPGVASLQSVAVRGSKVYVAGVLDHASWLGQKIGIVALTWSIDPTLDSISNLTISEDTPQRTVNLTGITAGGGESQPLRVTAASSNPSLIPTPSVSYASPSNTGSISFAPQLDAFGTSIITVTVEDGGTDGNLATAADNATFSRSFTVTVNPVNDAPTAISLSSTQLPENAGPNATVGTLSTTDPDAGNTFTYTLVSGTGDADNAEFNISGSTLRATKNFDFQSKSSYTVRVRSTDQGGLFVERAFTITVTQNTEAILDFDTKLIPFSVAGPVIGEIASGPWGDYYRMTDTNSGGGTSLLALDRIVEGLPSTIEVEFDFRIGDHRFAGNPADGIAVGLVSTTTYGVSGTPNTNEFLSVHPKFPRLKDAMLVSLATFEERRIKLGFDSKDWTTYYDAKLEQAVSGVWHHWRMTITQDGSDKIVNLWLTNGSNETFKIIDSQRVVGAPATEVRVVMYSHTGATASRHEFDNLKIRTTPANLSPTLDRITDLTIDEDAPLQAINLTGITAGGGESQPLRVTAASSNPSLIPTPSVSYTSPSTTGSISFAPQLDAFGTSIITVTVEDGGTDGNLATAADNARFSRSFTVTVNPFNDPPTLNTLDDLKISEDSGSQVINLSGITAGGAEAQPVRITAVSSNPELIPNPVVAYNDSRFQPGVEYAAGATTHGTESGDFNGDSILDVAVVHRTGGNVSVYYGVGNGTFQNPVFWSMNSNSYSLVVKDFNGDGRDDIVVTNFENNWVSIRLSTGNSFSALKTFATGNGKVFPASTGADPIQAGDFNNDGKLDLVIGNTRHHFLSILLGDGQGNFSLPIVSDVDPSGQLARPHQIGPISLAVADFNGDSKLDVAVGLLGKWEAGADIPGDLRIMLGDGKGNLSLHRQYESGQYMSSVLSQDFNGDSYADIVISSVVENGVVAEKSLVYIGDGNGNFSVAQALPTGAAGFRTADINKDGKLDLLAFASTKSFFLYYGDGSGKFSGPIAVDNPKGANRGGIVGDFDGNGWIDVAWGVGGGYVNGTLATWLGRDSSVGTLSLSPIANQFGKSTITVNVEDGGLDGNLATAADNSTFSRSFTVTVNPVNDIPTLIAPSSLSVDEDAPKQTVSLTGITAGGGESQPLRITASSSNLALIPHPELDYTSPESIASLSFQPIPRTSGLAVIRVYVEDGGLDQDLNTPIDNSVLEVQIAVVVNAIWEPIVAGLSQVTAGISGPVIATSEEWITLVSGDDDTTSPSQVFLGRTYGQGKVFAQGHTGFFANEFIHLVDNARFADNLFAALSQGITKSIGMAGIDEPTFSILASRLKQNGYNVKPLWSAFLGPEDLKDLSILYIPNKISAWRDGELAAISDFVHRGGRLIIGGLGWSWETYHPDMSFDDYPANQLGKIFDVYWGTSYVIDPTHNQYLVDPSLPESRKSYAVFHTFYPLGVPSQYNYPPTLNSLPNRWITEDASEQAINLAGITDGQNESQPLRVSASSSRPSLIPNPTVQYDSPSSSGSLSYRPLPNEFGSATITVTVEDGGLDRNLETTADNATFSRSFTITVIPVNDTPSDINLSSTTISENAGPNATVGTLSTADVDAANTFTYTLVAGAGDADNAAFNIVGSTLRATNSFDFETKSSYTIRVRTTDQGGLFTEKAFLVVVTDANDVPIALPDSYWVSLGTPQSLQVLDNDSDVDGSIDRTTIEIVRAPANGVAIPGVGGTISYTPNAGFRGTEILSYRVKDLEGAYSNEAIVTLQVNSAPLAVADSFVVKRNTEASLNVLGNDSDPDGSIQVGSLTIVTQPGNVDLSVMPDGRILFTPRSGFLGSTSFQYVVSDNEGRPSELADVTVLVVVSVYQNPRNKYDVDGDQTVSPLDVLSLINLINEKGPSISVDGLPGPPDYVDVNGDNRLDPIDVLEVVNFINFRQDPGGEGESEGILEGFWQEAIVSPWDYPPTSQVAGEISPRSSKLDSLERRTAFYIDHARASKEQRSESEVLVRTNTKKGQSDGKVRPALAQDSFAIDEALVDRVLADLLADWEVR